MSGFSLVQLPIARHHAQGGGLAIFSYILDVYIMIDEI